MSEALAEVAGKPAPSDNRTTVDGARVLWDFLRIGWDADAKEYWYDYEYEIRRKPSGEERDVWIRVPEYALRLATIVAVFRGSFVVDLTDLKWAIAVSANSATKIIHGLREHGSEDLETVELIRLIRQKLQQKGALTKGAVWKICENKTNDHRKIWAAITHLVTLGEAEEVEPSEVGRPTEGKWRWHDQFKE